MTKEEILGKYIKISGTDTPKEIYKAMDEYAKSIAIGFGDWVAKNGVALVSDKEGRYWISNDWSPIGYPKYTTEALFNQYIQTLKQ